MNPRVIFAVFLGVAATLPASAGSGNRTGTNGASELLIPIGTRDIALGGATVATTSGPEALFWNPAGVAKMERDVTIYASHMSYIADIGVDCGSVSAQLGQFGLLALQIKVLSAGDIPVTTVLTPDGSGQTFKPQFFTIGLTYARRLTDRVAVGATATLISENMAEVSANGFAFDMGVIYESLASVKGLTFGVVVKNIGPQMKFDGPGLDLSALAQALKRPAYLYKIEAASFELPSTIELGLGYTAKISDNDAFTFSTAFQNNNFSDDAYRFGLEYGFQNMFFVRGGYDYSPAESARRENIFGATFGAGVHYGLGSMDFVFDYAFRATKFFDNNHVFSVKLGV